MCTHLLRGAYAYFCEISNGPWGSGPDSPPPSASAASAPTSGVTPSVRRSRPEGRPSPLGATISC